MSDHVRFDDVFSILDEIVALFPDRTNDLCVYTGPDGQPCCLVAHVFVRLGLRLPPYRGSEVAPSGAPWDPNHSDVRRYLHEIGVEDRFTRAAMSLLEATQREADITSVMGEPQTWKKTWETVVRNYGRR